MYCWTLLEKIFLFFCQNELEGEELCKVGAFLSSNFTFLFRQTFFSECIARLELIAFSQFCSRSVLMLIGIFNCSSFGAFCANKNKNRREQMFGILSSAAFWEEREAERKIEKSEVRTLKKKKSKNWKILVRWGDETWLMLRLRSKDCRKRIRKIGRGRQGKNVSDRVRQKESEN